MPFVSATLITVLVVVAVVLVTVIVTAVVCKIKKKRCRKDHKGLFLLRHHICNIQSTAQNGVKTEICQLLKE